ncbi:hypothetical protein PIB30_002474 [Stylosanthes scabra]|uniref:Uncharacterized protein n=1 Tax=Stylosanthes scabra TaxID=79078 RepID=A0ABU6X2Y4_9FABA|nr:hypothetical protein [Stylosanthes scabra]
MDSTVNFLPSEVTCPSAHYSPMSPAPGGNWSQKLFLYIPFTIGKMEDDGIWRNNFWLQFPPGAGEMGPECADGHVAPDDGELTMESISQVGPAIWSCVF